MTGILARFPENIVIEVSNSLEVGNIGFILFFLESVLWLIIISFIIHIVRKIPLQYVSYIKTNVSINKVSRYIPLKITSSLMMPIIFSETIILLTNSFIPHFSNENFKTFFEDKYGIWYNCIYTFFYRYMALSIRKIGYDLKRYDAYIPRIKPGIETINILSISEIIYKRTFPGAIFLVIIATFSTIIVGINRSLSLFYGGSSLLIIVDGILDTLQRK